MDTIAVQELKVSELRALLKHRGACTTGNKGELQQRMHDNIELWKLQDENEKLTTRVKKLEAVRLTKEQCAALKRMKIERLQFMKKCEALEKINEILYMKLAGYVLDDKEKAEAEAEAKVNVKVECQDERTKPVTRSALSDTTNVKLE
jgi:hypothetical protein